MNMILNAMPDYRAQFESLQRALQEKAAQVAELEAALRQERQRAEAFEMGAAELKTVLSPLYQALRHIFGEIDSRGMAGSATVPKNSAAWEQWKQRLGGMTARAIDALMVHGEMNQTQLRIILGCAARTVTNVVTALNQAKLIDKNGGKIKLKEL